MRQGVQFELHFLVEAAPAYYAHVGLAVRVYLDVSVEVGDAVERLAALVARVGLDGGVRELVSGQVAGLSKGAAANVALERFLARVNALQANKVPKEH